MSVYQEKVSFTKDYKHIAGGLKNNFMLSFDYQVSLRVETFKKPDA